jgi:hypothetical protein
MREKLSEPPRNEVNRVELTVLQEYGDVKDVRRVFGLTQTFVYHLWWQGKIKGVLVPGRGKKRGKRLFDFASIRKLLTDLEAKEKPSEVAALHPRR